MVLIAAPAGWVMSSAAEAPLPGATAASAIASPFANEPGTTAASEASATSTKFVAGMAHLVQSPAVLWSTSAVALLSLAGLGAAFALHGSSEPATRPAQLSTAEADATTIAAPGDKQPNSAVCTGLATAMDAQSQIEFPADDHPAKPIELANHEPQQSTIEPTQPAEPEADVTTASNRPAERAAEKTSASTSAAPRTLKLEPIPADATTFDSTTTEPLPGSISQQYPPVSENIASSDSEIHGEDRTELRAETASLQAAVNSRRLMRFGPTTQDATHRTNIADQVAVPIKSFDVSGVPLKRVLDTLANMAAVPIAVDPTVLSAADVSLDTQVTVHAHDLTLGKLLGGVLREQNLACEVRDGQLVIVKRSSGEPSTP